MKCDWISGPTRSQDPSWQADNSERLSMTTPQRPLDRRRAPYGRLHTDAAHREGRWLLIWVDNLLYKLAQGMTLSENNNERLLSHQHSFETIDFN